MAGDTVAAVTQTSAGSTGRGGRYPVVAPAVADSLPKHVPAGR